MDLVVFKVLSRNLFEATEENHIEPNTPVDSALTYTTCIPEVRSLNLGRGSGSFHRSFSAFPVFLWANSGIVS
jgi:hypothetical protein